jgi:hypothetical protein
MVIGGSKPGSNNFEQLIKAKKPWPTTAITICHAQSINMCISISILLN